MAATSPEQAVVHTNMEEWLTSLRLQEYAPAFAAQSVELANTGCIDDAMLVSSPCHDDDCVTTNVVGK